MLRRLSLNEQRIKTLNSMRSTHYVEERLYQNRVEDKTPKTDDRWDMMEDNNMANSLDAMKDTATAMYVSTGDVVWLAF